MLAKKTVDIRDFHQSLLLTQVHFGSDKEQYKTRSRLNFDWDRAEPIVLDGTNDTIYHYTVWYWDKNNYKESNTIKDELLIEIPSSYKQ